LPDFSLLSGLGGIAGPFVPSGAILGDYEVGKEVPGRLPPGKQERFRVLVTAWVRSFRQGLQFRERVSQLLLMDSKTYILFTKLANPAYQAIRVRASTYFIINDGERIKFSDEGKDVAIFNISELVGFIREDHLGA
jgi:hypothetical protein